MLVNMLARDHGVMGRAPAPYMIRIDGHLGDMMLSAFPTLVPQRHGAHTVLTGLLDQSALYGVLAEIEAFGLDLLEIRKLTADRKSSGSSHRAHHDGHYCRARLFRGEMVALPDQLPSGRPARRPSLHARNAACSSTANQAAGRVRSMDRGLLVKNAVPAIGTSRTFGIPVVHRDGQCRLGQDSQRSRELAGLLTD